MTEPRFSSLPLSQAMLHNLKELGFTGMTPIQAESLPHILNQRDIVAQAKTGSGKTAAFGIGLLHALDVRHYRIQSLVLCPTRELADQVAKELRRLARAIHNVKVLTLTGGVAFGPQYGSLLHGAHIIVGTPGRVLKHLDKGYLCLDDLNTLVLDEADRMLDMGFIEELERIIAHAPEKRQTLLFSATYPDEILELSGSVQREGIRIQTISAEPANKIGEYFYQVAAGEKRAGLLAVIAHHAPRNALVFCNTKLEVRKVATALAEAGIEALALHGDLEQYERNEVLVRFSNESCKVLVATDVAARGIDISELALVVNYDLPKNPETYTHRIGRTARAGKEGVAVSLYNDDEDHRIITYRNDSRFFGEVAELDSAKAFTLGAANGTLVVEAGKKDKMRPADLLGALTGEAEIPGEQVGRIDIFDRHSYVAIDKAVIEQACDRLNRGRIKGRSLPVWILG
ncbi:ATP-dependent RNA helicase DbpA [Desulfogranum mediterraneum]|uniref:ATP-dependent RNA helicase DbpA n=1 Tax=Desulfogranum mediterraneum TaxID=160661 RepID=UPI000415EFCD|nr:ATP-dependent RNA helicase DbpA [Desulfogranum mediterraneum]